MHMLVSSISTCSPSIIIYAPARRWLKVLPTRVRADCASPLLWQYIFCVGDAGIQWDSVRVHSWLEIHKRAVCEQQSTPVFPYIFSRQCVERCALCSCSQPQSQRLILFQLFSNLDQFHAAVRRNNLWGSQNIFSGRQSPVPEL